MIGEINALIDIGSVVSLTKKSVYKNFNSSMLKS